MKKYLAITLLIGMVCAMSVAFAGESYWTVGYPDLFLRSTPSTEHPYLERMPYGSEVIMISDGADWALVYYNGQYGYCKREYKELSQRDQDIIWMRHVENMEYSEMAKMLNMQEGAIRTAIVRAKAKLRLLVQKGGLRDEE